MNRTASIVTKFNQRDEEIYSSGGGRGPTVVIREKIS